MTYELPKDIKKEHLLFGIQQAIAVEHMNTSKHFMLNGQMMCSFVVLIDFAVFGLNTHLYNISTQTYQSVWKMTFMKSKT